MRRHEFTLDRFTRCVLLAITALLTMIVIELWAARPDMLPAATAQVPDSGRQRLEMIKATRKTNRLLEQILQHLRAKPIKVTIQTTDKSSGTKSRPGKP